MTEREAHNTVLIPGEGMGSALYEWTLRCPVCGPGQWGLDRCGGDDASVTVHPDRDDYGSPLGTRGGWVTIKYFCPAGHELWLTIANHKGQEFIGLDYVGELPDY
jgi:hypothetical protein